MKWVITLEGLHRATANASDVRPRRIEAIGNKAVQLDGVKMKYLPPGALFFWAGGGGGGVGGKNGVLGKQCLWPFMRAGFDLRLAKSRNSFHRIASESYSCGTSAERWCPWKVFNSIRKMVWKTRKRIRKRIRKSGRLKSESIFGKGMRRSTFQWKKRGFQWKGGRQFSESGVW